MILLLVFSSILFLRPDTTITETPTITEEQHDQEKPYRPQTEEQEGQLASTMVLDTGNLESPAVTEEHPTEAQANPPQREEQEEQPTSDTAVSTPNLVKLPHAAETSTTEAAAASSTGYSKAIVMGKLSSEDTDWVAQELSDWQNAVYVVDLPSNATSPTGLRTKVNKSKEAMPYLTYIIDHYPDFPDVMAFIHAHRLGWPEAWHTDAKNHDAVNMLRDLRLETVVKRGYVNLRCLGIPGCPDEIRPWRNPPDPEKLPESIYPYVYADFFNLPLSEVRKQIEVVATPCCAQFAVSREQILEKPKEEYERYRTYLDNTTYDDDTIGRVLEYMWHIIFGREAVHCDEVSSCQCEVFGRCSSHRAPGGRHKSGGTF